MSENEKSVFRTGYIINNRADWFWFVTLPFIALAIAIYCQSRLTAVALASISLWITIPHHYATWVRAYGITEDRKRWITRLIIGPIVIFAFGFTGLYYAPNSMLLLALLWDNQHSIMQQYGFSRIYDFKAKTGAKSTGRFDFALNWILFGNLFLSSPFFTPIWLKTLHKLHLPLSVESVHTIQNISFAVVIVFSIVYIGHLIWCLANGYQLNPIKYLFIFASYFLWYYAGWHTHSILVFAIAHRIMHGLQYIVIAYFYTQRRTEGQQDPAARLVGRGHLFAFVMTAMFYAFAFHIITNQPFTDIGFGLFGLPENVNYPLDNLGLGRVGKDVPYDTFALAVAQMAAFTHYYFDSFIWKVRDSKTRKGL